MAGRTERKVTLGLVQMACSPDPEENVAKALSRIEEAADAGAQIVCTQELFRGKYFCQEEEHAQFALAEPLPGPTTERLGTLAKAKGIVIVSSHFERRAAGVYHNTAVVTDADGTLLGLYRKMHIPDDPHYYEKFYFAPGDLGFRAWETRFGRIGVLVCWDQWYPEAARLTALQGAEILFYPTAIGWHHAEKARYGETQHDSWETIQRSHAIANGLYVAAVNRVGTEDNLEFWGQSFVADPQGRILTRASVETEEVVLVEVDLARNETVRRHWPFLRDRRIDAYGDLTRRFVD
ncbi:carbon-nitrogen hydrolase [Candidatus Poribacteria bacterium]|nr:carbon-nitrogen hydrolase [Candidatus Poribacteria bacterium]